MSSEPNVGGDFGKIAETHCNTSPKLRQSTSNWESTTAIRSLYSQMDWMWTAQLGSRKPQTAQGLLVSISEDEVVVSPTC